jgi:hypothetical protein
MLPASWDPASLTLPQALPGMLLITMHPAQAAPAVLSSVDIMIAMGESPEQTMRRLSEAVYQRPPELAPLALGSEEAVAWMWRTEEKSFRFHAVWSYPI